MATTFRKALLSTTLVAALTGGVYYFYPHVFSDSKVETKTFTTEQVSLGDISNTVSATGTLAAVDDVVVGAQLSGQVIKVYSDFNDNVERGQLLAKIDPASFIAQVSQAQALVNKSASDQKAQEIRIQRAKLAYERSVRELARSQELYNNKSISEDTLDTLETENQQLKLDWKQSIVELDILQATYDSNLASLDKAKIELDRTDIRAPISGFVINRNIEAGQTVASSYNTPELFTLAKDLTEMEIEAYVDESDIGLIEEGQRVAFGVDAFTNREFQGRVKQIRKAPQDNSGVVSYVVVIETTNKGGILLPGMTANLEISIQKMHDVQRVTNAAVRMASRFEVSASNQEKGPLARLKYLNLSKEQRQKLKELRPNKTAGSSPNANRQQRQMMNKLLSNVLTEEQRALRKQIKDGDIKMGPILLLREGKIETVYAQMGVSDDKYTAIIHPDLSNEVIVNQYRENK